MAETKMQLAMRVPSEKKNCNRTAAKLRLGKHTESNFKVTRSAKGMMGNSK